MLGFLFQYINKTYIFVGENAEICAKQMLPVSLPACTDKNKIKCSSYKRKFRVEQLQSHI
jgi:hypothetical protein